MFNLYRLMLTIKAQNKYNSKYWEVVGGENSIINQSRGHGDQSRGHEEHCRGYERNFQRLEIVEIDLGMDNRCDIVTIYLYYEDLFLLISFDLFFVLFLRILAWDFVVYLWSWVAKFLILRNWCNHWTIWIDCLILLIELF